MPINPTARALHADKLLTNYGISYGTDINKSFVADRVTTPVPVEFQSDKYPKWDKGDLFRSEMKKRGDGDASEGSGQRMSQETYFAEVYALHTKLTDRQKKNSDVDVESAKIRYLMHQAKLKRDKIFADAAFGTGIWSGFTDQTGVAGAPGANQFRQWSNYTNSTPISDITDKAIDLELAAGVPGVKLMAVTNRPVFNALRHHPNMLDRIKYTAGVSDPASVTPEIMAAVLGIDEIVLARAPENTAAEGQTASMSWVFGNGFLLQYVNPSASDEDPTATTMFKWSEFDDVAEDGVGIYSWYEKKYKSTIYEVEQAIDIKVTAADMGGFFTSCIA